VCINSINDASISCKNFVNFDPVTPEKNGAYLSTICTTWQKTAYLVEYLRIYWTDFYDIFTL